MIPGRTRNLLINPTDATDHHAITETAIVVARTNGKLREIKNVLISDEHRENNDEKHLSKRDDVLMMMRTIYNQEKSDTPNVTTRNARIRDARTRDARTRDARTRDARIRDARTRDARIRDAKTRDAKTRDAKTRDVKTRDAKTRDAKTRDARTRNAKIRDLRIRTPTKDCIDDHIQKREVEGEMTNVQMTSLDIRLQKNTVLLENIDYNLTKRCSPFFNF